MKQLFEKVDVGACYLWQVDATFLVKELVELLLAADSLANGVHVDLCQLLVHVYYRSPLYKSQKERSFTIC